MAVSILKPPHGGFRSKTAVNGYKFITAICNGHLPNGEKYPFGCSGYVTAVAAGQSQRFYSGVGMSDWYYLSSPPQILRAPGAVLESAGSQLGLPLPRHLTRNLELYALPALPRIHFTCSS
jgi:hypothetical protein